MTPLEQAIIDKLNSIKKQITDRAIDMDQVVSGETIQSLTTWYRGSNIQLVGNENILKLEYGTSPAQARGQSDLVPSLKSWIIGRGLSFNPKSLASRISESGTLLYQGEDKRFPGSKQSGTISDFVNEEIIPEIEKIVRLQYEITINEQLKPNVNNK